MPPTALPPAADAFELQAETLRALAHPKRLRILHALGDSARPVSAIAKELAMSLPNVSQHLRVLRDRGVVRSERVGKEVRYRVSNPAFQTCCTLVRRVIVEEARRRHVELGELTRADLPRKVASGAA
jgi:ArsR family transcriptional regulator